MNYSCYLEVFLKVLVGRYVEWGGGAGRAGEPHQLPRVLNYLQLGQLLTQILFAKQFKWSLIGTWEVYSTTNQARLYICIKYKYKIEDPYSSRQRAREARAWFQIIWEAILKSDIKKRQTNMYFILFPKKVLWKNNLKLRKKSIRKLEGQERKLRGRG